MESEKVIVLKRRNGGRFVHTIYQEDLERFLLYSRELTEARERWETQRDYIRAALASGAAIEWGIHTAELESFMRRDYSVFAKTVTRLVVR